jgi:hypothetical protein
MCVESWSLLGLIDSNIKAALRINMVNKKKEELPVG